MRVCVYVRVCACVCVYTCVLRVCLRSELSLLSVLIIIDGHTFLSETMT